MSITGALFIGAQQVTTPHQFQGRNPATGEVLAPSFCMAKEPQIAQACALADAAFDAYRETSSQDRAAFLQAIADEILALGDVLIERAMAETGLPRPRLEGERGRTMGQLNAFAAHLRAGDWQSVRVDHAMPERQPLPRRDLRQRKIAIGPVAIFGASNFPLAFSVAGGDTASALAAGCPVVVKGHPAHPGTSALVASAVIAAAKQSGMPDGVFSLLHGDEETGATLVQNPSIKAVGFTGSRNGGLALFALANGRPEPIPVFAEMSSVNPVILLPAALEQDAEELGNAFIGSLTMGAGQFCTNPGLIIALDSPALDRFSAAAAAALAQSAPACMLTSGIHSAYEAGKAAMAAHLAVTALGEAQPSDGTNACHGALFEVAAAAVLADATLLQEVFGACSLVVRCEDVQQLRAVLEGLEGQLTATLHMQTADRQEAASLLPILERKAGRILVNGWPTGVEVCPAMVHGGPFPATSDSRTTSVGTLAIERFLRPVCYENLPDGLLPAALKHGNPLHISRLVDGVPEAGK